MNNLSLLRARAWNTETQAMARMGFCLSYEEADSLGEEILGWISHRMGLRIVETDMHVECRLS